MLYKKQQWIFVAILLATGAHFSPLTYDRSVRLTPRDLVRRVRKIDPIKLNQELLKNVDFSKIFKELHEHLSPEEVRMVTTLGLVAGVLRAKDSMREYLYVLTDDLLATFDSQKPRENMEKLVEIERAMNRDRSVVNVLNGMLRYARNATTLDALQTELLDILKENENALKRLQSKKSEMDKTYGTELRYQMKEQLYEIRENIDNHAEQIHASITENAKQTLRFIQKMQRNNKNIRQRPISADTVKLDPSLFAVRRLWDQVAAEDASSYAHDFNVAFNYQYRNLRSQMSSKEPQTTESVVQKNEEQMKQQENKTRLTKGEEEEMMARTSRSVENSQLSALSMVKMIMVNAKIGRFKRKIKTVNGKMDMDPFELSVDIDFVRKNDDTDGKSSSDGDDEKPKTEMEIKMKKRTAADDDNEVEGFGDDEHKSENQETVLPLEGGLAGLITNLSGGPDGSDIGSVVAALSSVLNNVFGPGGIDLQGIVGTGTALLASLIGGDENFGRVLANIAGLSIEGFSGGGGADKNGQFFGQFFGRFISILSADPEDPDDSPLRPALFIENFYDGIGKGSANTPDPDAEESVDGGGLNKEPNFGSDSSSFIKSVIGGLFSVITSAATSSSAGYSQHSAQASIDSAGHSSNSSIFKFKDKYSHKDKDNNGDDDN